MTFKHNFVSTQWSCLDAPTAESKAPTGNLKLPSHPPCMLLEGGRKPENVGEKQGRHMENTHAAHGRIPGMISQQA